ncbi:unnamed protein product [Prorocentrum cordatum]|uniref:Uncharacterized protein n=1 Tax=Prorocentrum cordatum TaxID=2364126 RepID=A0ABN9VTM8_9DINO|nr:unnamed protein product [Polarella glacialis]
MSERQVDAQVRRAEAHASRSWGACTPSSLAGQTGPAAHAWTALTGDARGRAWKHGEGDQGDRLRVQGLPRGDWRIPRPGGWRRVRHTPRAEAGASPGDRAEEVEEHREAKLWKLATKKVENQMVKEKLYLHRRAMLEHETHQWLAQEAEAMRRTAATLGALGEDGEILQMLDISKGDLDGMMIAMETFGRQGHDNMTGLWIEDKLAASRSKVEYASAKMLEAVKHKVETFKSMNPSDYDDRQFLVRLAHLLDDTRAEIGSVEEVKERERGRLENWDKADGEKLTYSLGLSPQE